MNKEILKSALFGYSKISVCQYIATMNEGFNAKLLAEADSFREERLKMQKKIDDLEAELAVHKRNACDVGAMLMEAGEYAAQLQRNAKKEATELLQQAQEEAERIRTQTKQEMDQLLLETQTKCQTQKLELWAMVKLREDMAILASRADDALNTFAEQFLNSRQDSEDSEL
jgi:cell division septum initiation protein DivIVA